MKLIICFIISLITTLWGSSLWASPQWSVYGTEGVISDEFSDAAVQRISFDPSKTAPGNYWCGARLTFDAPTAARKVSFGVCADKSSQLHIKVVSGSGRESYRIIDVYPMWDDVVLDYTEELDNISTFEIIFFGQWEAINVEIKDISFIEKKPAKEHARFWMPETVPSPAPGYRIETTIHSCWRNGKNTFSGIGTAAGRAMALDIVKKLKAEFGDISTAFVFAIPPEESPDNVKNFVRELQDMGVVVLSEGHDNPAQEDVEKYDIYARNIHGETYPDTFHNGDKTNPEMLRLLHERLAPAASFGVDVYRSVDYIWQHHGGPVWGYSEAACKRWVEDLTGKDILLEIVDANGTRSKVGFHDYFNSYFGYTMTPADCGLSSWEEYLPPAADEADSPARRNKHTLFVALYHYEWVKFLNESVRPYEAQGMRAQPTLNPESQYNGTDLYWMLKSSLTRGWCTEWWYSPHVIIPVYYHSKYYGNLAAKFNKEVIHLGETGAAGNGFGTLPNYWDNMANYLVTYVKAAACDAAVMNDQYWGASYEDMTNPENPELYDMYTGFRSAWSGFVQSKHDKAIKPSSGVLVVQNRGVMHNIANFDNSAGNGPFSIAQDLIANNYTYDGAAFPIDDAYDLEDYNVIVYTAMEPAAGFGKKIAHWLQNAPGRVLVVHSDITNREAAPVKDIAAADAPFKTGRVFPLLPEIRQSGITSGVINTSFDELAWALDIWNGSEFTFPQPLAEVSGGNVLVSLGNAPLISEFIVGESRIIYLHNVHMQGGSAGKKLQQALVRAAMTAAGVYPAGFTPSSHRLLVFDRENAAGKVVFIINNEAETVMERDGVNHRVYQALNPDADGEFVLCGLASGSRYTCRNMITGEVIEITTDANGTAAIPYTGWDLAGFYVDPVE